MVNKVNDIFQNCELVILAYSNAEINTSDIKKKEPLNNFKYYT